MCFSLGVSHHPCVFRGLNVVPCLCRFLNSHFTFRLCVRTMRNTATARIITCFRVSFVLNTYGWLADWFRCIPPTASHNYYNCHCHRQHQYYLGNGMAWHGTRTTINHDHHHQHRQHHNHRNYQHHHHH